MNREFCKHDFTLNLPSMECFYTNYPYFALSCVFQMKNSNCRSTVTTILDSSCILFVVVKLVILLKPFQDRRTAIYITKPKPTKGQKLFENQGEQKRLAGSKSTLGNFEDVWDWCESKSTVTETILLPMCCLPRCDLLRHHFCQSWLSRDTAYSHII